jgi:hypothetical protein
MRTVSLIALAIVLFPQSNAAAQSLAQDGKSVSEPVRK